MADRLRIFDSEVDQIVDLTDFHLQKLLAIVRAYEFVREGREPLEVIDMRLHAELAEIKRHRAMQAMEADADPDSIGMSMPRPIGS